MDNLEWLHKHGRTQLPYSSPTDRNDPMLSSNAPPGNEGKVGRIALDLVYHAAEVVKSIEDRASDVETRARTLADEATERLKLAEKHIQELEAKQRAADAYISEANVKLQEAAEALKTERARVIAAERQLPVLEMRVKTAESRARECENAIARVEDAIRARILRQGAPGASKSPAAA